MSAVERSQNCNEKTVKLQSARSPMVFYNQIKKSDKWFPGSFCIFLINFFHFFHILSHHIYIFLIFFSYFILFYLIISTYFFSYFIFSSFYIFTWHHFLYYFVCDFRISSRCCSSNQSSSCLNTCKTVAADA